MTATTEFVDRPVQQNLDTVPDYGPASMSVLVIPVLADGSPDWDRRLAGVMASDSAEEARLELETARNLVAGAIMVVVKSTTGFSGCAGLMVREMRRLDRGKFEVVGRRGGFAEELLRPEHLTPRFDRDSLEFGLGFPDAVLQKWADIGVLEAVVADRLTVCPKCHGLPTFRQGCTNCGSIRLTQVQFIHHFGCAHVGPVTAFDQLGELTCPKCRTRRLIPGSDFEYLPGPFCCQECHWNDTLMEDVGRCLCCDLRFPRFQAHELELKGYHANRLDPLVLVAES